MAGNSRPWSPQWRVLALELERYRRAGGITSRVGALGGVPDRPEETVGWDRLADRIARHQGVAALGFDHLCVVATQAARRQEQAALSRLEERRWFGVLSPKEAETITGMATLVLRRHVRFAVGLLGERPPDRAARLAAVQAALAAAGAYLADHKAAMQQAAARRKMLGARPTQALAAERRRLDARIEAHRQALARLAVVQRRLERQQAELRRETGQRQRWDSRSQLPLAIGLHSAYELARRELELLLDLEREPPAYLVRELGSVPEGGGGLAAWWEGARLIERYRAQHNIQDPATALGSRPVGQIVDQVQALRVQIRRSAATLDRPALAERPAIDLQSP